MERTGRSGRRRRGLLGEVGETLRQAFGRIHIKTIRPEVCGSYARDDLGFPEQATAGQEVAIDVAVQSCEPIYGTFATADFDFPDHSTPMTMPAEAECAIRESLERLHSPTVWSADLESMASLAMHSLPVESSTATTVSVAPKLECDSLSAGPVDIDEPLCLPMPIDYPQGRVRRGRLRYPRTNSVRGHVPSTSARLSRDVTRGGRYPLRRRRTPAGQLSSRRRMHALRALVEASGLQPKEIELQSLFEPLPNAPIERMEVDESGSVLLLWFARGAKAEGTYALVIGRSVRDGSRVAARIPR